MKKKNILITGAAGYLGSMLSTEVGFFKLQCNCSRSIKIR